MSTHITYTLDRTTVLLHRVSYLVIARLYMDRLLACFDRMPRFDPESCVDKRHRAQCTRRNVSGGGVREHVRPAKGLVPAVRPVVHAWCCMQREGQRATLPYLRKNAGPSVVQLE